MNASQKRHTVLAVLYGLPFVWVGVQHFIRPEIFVPLMPSYFGWPEFWVHLTGWTEIALGVGIMLPRFRKRAAQLMVAQLGLLYLANLNMWLNDIPFDGHQLGTTGHVLRLLVQALLIAAAVWVGRTAPAAVRDAST
jgi:uncharacterized membrane protein